MSSNEEDTIVPDKTHGVRGCLNGGKHFSLRRETNTIFVTAREKKNHELDFFYLFVAYSKSFMAYITKQVAKENSSVIFFLPWMLKIFCAFCLKVVDSCEH